MYTAPFRFVRPASLKEAEAAFAAAQDPRYLAGGQTLIPAMKLRLSAPSDLIDLTRLSGFDRIGFADGKLVIGAGARHADVAESDAVRTRLPALAALAGGIGDPAVRHRGTLGGSLANNDPAADYPAAALALGAEIRTSRRTLGADAFFTSMFTTALEDGEIITEIAFPIPARAAYMKFPNPASRYAMVGVFVACFTEGARVAVTGAGPCVFRVPAMEQALTRHFVPDAVADIRVPADGLSGDIHGSADYRAHLVTVMAKRAVAAALT